MSHAYLFVQINTPLFACSLQMLLANTPAIYCYSSPRKQTGSCTHSPRDLQAGRTTFACCSHKIRNPPYATERPLESLPGLVTTVTLTKELWSFPRETPVGWPTGQKPWIIISTEGLQYGLEWLWILGKGRVIYPRKISFPRRNYHREFLAHISKGTGRSRRPGDFPLLRPSPTLPFHSMGRSVAETEELPCVSPSCGVVDGVKTCQQRHQSHTRVVCPAVPCAGREVLSALAL